MTLGYEAMRGLATQNSEDFINGIINAGYDPREVIENWIVDLNKPIVRNLSYCICKQRIKYIFTLYNPKNIEERLEIGSICAANFIKNIIKKKTGKSCEVCGLQHRNTKDNRCKTCRKLKKIKQIQQVQQQIKQIQQQEPIKCPNYDICQAMVNPPFKVCFKCNQKNMKEKKTNTCKCGIKIEPKYKECYKCKFTNSDN